MRPGGLETLDLHLAREIWMTNLKLGNYAQECLLRLPNSGFCYSVLRPPFFLIYFCYIDSLYKITVMSPIPSPVLVAFHIVAGRSVCVISV